MIIKTHSRRDCAPIQRYCMNVPKLGDISDLKVAIGKRVSILSQTMQESNVVYVLNSCQ